MKEAAFTSLADLGIAPTYAGKVREMCDLGDSILMMMECKSKYAKKQTNGEEVNKFLIHHSIRTEPLLFSKKTINKQYYNVLKLRRSTIFRQILHHIARVNPMSINGQYTP